MYFIVEEVGFIHHGRMTSYNLWRHILHTHSKSILHVLHTDCTFLLFYSFFQWIQRRQKINVIKYTFSHLFLISALTHIRCFNFHFFIGTLLDGDYKRLICTNLWHFFCRIKVVFTNLNWSFYTFFLKWPWWGLCSLVLILF